MKNLKYIITWKPTFSLGPYSIFAPSTTASSLLYSTDSSLLYTTDRSLHYSTDSSLLYTTDSSLHYSTDSSLHYSTDSSLHYSTASSLHYSTDSSLLYSTALYWQPSTTDRSPHYTVYWQPSTTNSSLHYTILLAGQCCTTVDMAFAWQYIYLNLSFTNFPILPVPVNNDFWTSRFFPISWVFTSELPRISRHVKGSNPTFVENVSTMETFFLLDNEGFGPVLLFLI